MLIGDADRAYFLKPTQYSTEICKASEWMQ